jgi:hypothetical protein
LKINYLCKKKKAGPIFHLPILFPAPAYGNGMGKKNPLVFIIENKGMQTA